MKQWKRLDVTVWSIIGAQAGGTNASISLPVCRNWRKTMYSMDDTHTGLIVQLKMKLTGCQNVKPWRPCKFDKLEWKKRTHSHKLSSDHHTYAMVLPQPQYILNSNVILKKGLPRWLQLVKKGAYCLKPWVGSRQDPHSGRREQILQVILWPPYVPLYTRIHVLVCFFKTRFLCIAQVLLELTL